MNEVKYSNVLNTLRFSNFTVMDYNIFMALCQRMKYKGHDKIIFKFDELKQLTDFQDQNDGLFASDLERMAFKLNKVDAKYITGGKIAIFNLFPTFVIDTKKRTLTVKVNEDFTFILNELTDNFTNFELKEFVELDSKYAKTLYRVLKQYKMSGWWRPTVEELRIILDVPDNYSNKRIQGDILKPALKTLSEKFNDLNCEPIRAKKRGAPIERFYFTWQAEKQVKGQTNINDAEEEMQKYKKSKKKDPAKNTFTTMEQSPGNPKNKEEWDDFEKKVLDN